MRLSFAFCLFPALVVPLHAGLIIGTADSGSGNCYPFGCAPQAGAGTVYQQVYAPGDFSGTIDITSLSFFHTQNGAPTDALTNATFTVKLSYSAHPVDALDTTTFSNNVGSGQVTFGTYVLSGVTAGSGLTLVENNSDFVYNPLTGPLLVEVDLSSIGTRGLAYFDVMINSGGLFSRAHNFGTGFNDIGLVTGFDVSSVPEPATLALCGGGLLALGLLRRNRKPRG